MRSAAVIFAVLCAVLVAGTASAYLFAPETDLDASMGADGKVTVKADGALPSEISYLIMSGTSVPDRIYIYLDERYSGGFESYRQQARYADSVAGMLAERGYTSVEKIDADRLAQLAADPSAAHVSGIMFLSGSLPDTVYPDDSTNRMTDWLAAGGTVYWSGPEMGLCRALPDGSCVDTSGGMFGGLVNRFTEGKFCVSSVSENASAWKFMYGRAEYGLSASYSGSPAKILGLYGDYSSLSVVSMGGGRIYVLGSLFSDLEVESQTAYMDMIVSGVTENTVLTASGSFHKGYGSTSYRIDETVNPGDVVYVFSGKPVSESARLFGF